MTIVESDNKSTEITWQSREILWERKIGHSEIKREKLTRADGSQALITTIYASESANYNLMVDPRFEEFPIVLEPGGLLIDQAATEKAWGDPAGLKPEYFLESHNIPTGSVAIPPTNAGWQRGAFWVREGKPLTLANETEINGSFEVIGLSGNVWHATEVSFNLGWLQPEDSLDQVQIGFDMPLIIRDREIVPQIEILNRGDLRLLADFRNALDFSGGDDSDVPGKFWGLLRKFMPDKAAAARRITEEERFAVIRVREDVKEGDVDAFRQIIESTQLKDHWKVYSDGGKRRVVIYGKLPPNRLPLLGIGHDTNGNLIVTVVDGRQKDSTGATIDELAQIMRDRGAINAGLGSAGGDALVVAKTENRTKILNSPSNKDPETGERVTRLVPSILVIS